MGLDDETQHWALSMNFMSDNALSGPRKPTLLICLKFIRPGANVYYLSGMPKGYRRRESFSSVLSEVMITLDDESDLGVFLAEDTIFFIPFMHF